jgi:hypothetical protein
MHSTTVKKTLKTVLVQVILQMSASLPSWQFAPTWGWAHKSYWSCVSERCNHRQIRASKGTCLSSRLQTVPLTLPACEISLASVILSVPQAGDFLKLSLLYIL